VTITSQRTQQRRSGAQHAQRSHRPVQFACIAVIISAAWFTPWLVLHIDMTHPLSSVPFVLAFLYMVFQIHISIINNWHWSCAKVLQVPPGREPHVAVIVPTCGEPVVMIYRTLMSIIAQDWPPERLILIVSDDAWSHEISDMTHEVSRRNPRLAIRYHLPPKHGSPGRRGEAKAGNLNSALNRLRKEFPFVEFIETRDADDLVGDRYFLRRTVAVLCDDPRVAYTQTIKECKVSQGDPFNNREQLFYKGVMKGRHDANALFPCGSGLVWRRAALEDIGDFPSWNIVEDFQSGVEALKLGWRGAYVPIIGADAQHAPEDLANIIKQKGTWALDTVRLLIWRSLKGMNLRQRLQFLDMGLFYFQPFPMLVIWATSVIFVIQGTKPVVASQFDYTIHFLPYVAAIELFIFTMSREARVENFFAFRRMWYGLMFVYIKAFCLALWYGPNKKPTYRVTRKTNIAKWYWKETLPHFLVLTVVVGSIAYGAAVHGVINVLSPDTLYWLAITCFALGSYVPLGWFGLPTEAEATVSRPSAVDSQPSARAADTGGTRGAPADWTVGYSNDRSARAGMRAAGHSNAPSRSAQRTDVRPYRPLNIPSAVSHSADSASAAWHETQRDAAKTRVVGSAAARRADFQQGLAVGFIGNKVNPAFGVGNGRSARASSGHADAGMSSLERPASDYYPHSSRPPRYTGDVGEQRGPTSSAYRPEVPTLDNYQPASRPSGSRREGSFRRGESGFDPPKPDARFRARDYRRSPAKDMGMLTSQAPDSRSRPADFSGGRDNVRVAGHHVSKPQPPYHRIPPREAGP
jgi:cellulose synthase (UDP-forming)